VLLCVTDALDRRRRRYIGYRVSLDLKRVYEAPFLECRWAASVMVWRGCCLLLQDLYESCARGGSEESGRVMGP